MESLVIAKFGEICTWWRPFILKASMLPHLFIRVQPLGEDPFAAINNRTSHMEHSFHGKNVILIIMLLKYMIGIFPTLNRIHDLVLKLTKIECLLFEV